MIDYLLIFFFSFIPAGLLFRFGCKRPVTQRLMSASLSIVCQGDRRRRRCHDAELNATAKSIQRRRTKKTKSATSLATFCRRHCFLWIPNWHHPRHVTTLNAPLTLVPFRAPKSSTNFKSLAHSLTKASCKSSFWPSSPPSALIGIQVKILGIGEVFCQTPSLPLPASKHFHLK